MNNYKEFKFKKENLLTICRELKKDIKQAFLNKAIFEINLIYDVYEERFYLTNESIDKIENEGYINYKQLTFYSADNKKITIKNLMLEIFNL